MRNAILLLAAVTSIAMLVAVLAVVRYSVSIAVAFLPVVVVFVVLSALLFWRHRKRESVAYGAPPNKSRRALKWLFVTFVIGAIGAATMGLEEGWNIGDTIGAIFFGVSAL